MTRENTCTPLSLFGRRVVFVVAVRAFLASNESGGDAARGVEGSQLPP